MANVIRLKRTSTAGSVPASLADGEIAVQQADGALFWRDAAAAVQRLLFPKRRPVADAAYTIVATDTYVGLSSLTAARTFSLPAASAYPSGHILTLTDEIGACNSTRSVTVAASGSDVINGASSLVLTVPNFFVLLTSDGTSKWTASGRGVAVVGDVSAVTVAAFNNIPRGLADHLRSASVSLASFSAITIGTGSADDTAVVQAAVTYCLNNNRALYVPSPASFYKCSAAITGTGNLTIFGDSGRTAEFRFTGGTSGFVITLNNPNFAQHFSARDILITTTSAGVGSAIKVTATNGYADRITPNLIIERVTCRGATNPTVDGWITGIECDGVNQGIVRSCMISGKINSGLNSYASAYGIYYANAGGASPHPTTFLVEGCLIYNVNIAVYGNDFEGMLIQSNQFVGVGQGFGFSANPPAGAAPKNFPHVGILNNHINASSRIGSVDAMAEVIVIGNLLYTQNSAANATGIELTGGAMFFEIVNNIFENYNQSVAANMVVVTNGSNGKIGPNVYRRCNSIDGTVNGVAVWLTSNAFNIKVDAGGSTYGPVSTRFLNQGNNCLVSDAVLNGTDGTMTDTTGMVIKTGTAVITTDANGKATIPYTTPFKYAVLSSVPVCGDGASPVLVYPDPSGATPLANLYIIARSTAGALLANYTLRVNYIATGKDIPDTSPA